VHSTIIWIDREGDNIAFNSARGRVWPANLERDPRVTLTLLDARKLTRALSPQAQLHLVLPPRPGAVLSYKVRMEAGTVTFSDTSRPLPTEFAELELFTKSIAEDVCGISRG
jgi:hypothetical protein